MHRAIAGLAAAGYNLIANYALLNAPWKHEAAAIFDDTGRTPKALHVRQRFEQHVAFIDQVLHDLRFDGLKKALKMICLDVDLMFFAGYSPLATSFRYCVKACVAVSRNRAYVMECRG